MQQVPRGTKRASRSTKFVYHHLFGAGTSRYQEGGFHHAIPADSDASKELVAEGLGLGDGAEAAVDDLW